MVKGHTQLLLDCMLQSHICPTGYLPHHVQTKDLKGHCWWLVWSIMGVQTVYIRYIHTIQCYLLIRSNKYVLGRDIPSVGDFILKYSENFDYIKVRKGAPRLVASLNNILILFLIKLRSVGYIRWTPWSRHHPLATTSMFYCCLDYRVCMHHQGRQIVRKSKLHFCYRPRWRYWGRADRGRIPMSTPLSRSP